MTKDETAKMVAKFQELQSQLKRAEAENEALAAKLAKSPKMKVKIGKKGGISVYGLGRFPITLYSGVCRAISTPLSTPTPPI